jgi:hypothetical protein
MATVSQFQNMVNADDGRHAVWTKCFSSAQREEMLREDLFAGRSVAALLASLVTCGLLGLTFVVLSAL